MLTELDGRLPAVGSESAENPVPVGFWVMIHYMMKQHGYGWFDEIDACTKAIQNRLRSLADFHGEAAAQNELDAIRNELENLDITV